MDDRELETRLRTHLHARFDAMQPSAELVDGVRQLVATRPAPVGLAALRHRPVRFGFALAVAGVIGAIAIVGGYLPNPIDPGFGGVTPTPGASVPAETSRTFVVVPRFGTAPLIGETERAADILSERLRVLGYESFEVDVGVGIVYTLPLDGPSDDATTEVLEAVGDVAFVPLPPEDYGEGKLVAEVGQSLPKDEPVLFGWEGIAEIGLDRDAERDALRFALRSDAATALEAYTSAHVGETLAILVDGTVVAAPEILGAISGREVIVSSASANEQTFSVASAILLGGLLPDSWQEGQVQWPVLGQEAAAARAFEEISREIALGGGFGRADAVQSVALEVVSEGPGWLPVWNVVLSGQFTQCLPPPPDPRATPRACSSDDMLVVLDATNGIPISVQAPAPS